MLTVSVTILTIKGGGLNAVLTVIVTITGKYMCSANSFFDNNDNHREVYLQC